MYCKRVAIQYAGTYAVTREKMKSSIQDVAQLAHVSISTVSRSFTRPDLVSKATRDKVMKAADELNFSISRSAAALKTGRALRIAVLVSGRLNLWFSSSIIEGLNEIFHDEGYDISIYQMSSTEERREFFDMLPVRRNVDAVIVISFDIDANEIEQLRSVNVPIIGINSSLPEERGFSAAVRIDDKQGSELAARHLMALGHRDIAYIRTNRDVTPTSAYRGVSNRSWPAAKRTASRRACSLPTRARTTSAKS